MIKDQLKIQLSHQHSLKPTQKPFILFPQFEAHPLRFGSLPIISSLLSNNVR